MQEYQLRVIEEEKEVSLKLTALHKFFTTETWQSLPVDEKYLTLDQGEVMGRYINILKQRIARF